MLRDPVDLPPIVSVEFIQISKKTKIPFAPKAREIIEKVKKEKERVVSEQAPPSPKAKEAIIEAAAKSHLYPDGDSYHLKKAIALREGILPNQIVLLEHL